MAYMEPVENTNEDAKTTRIYEVGFLFVPTITEEALATDVGALKDSIGKHGVAFISEEFPKAIELAYTMDRTIDHKRQKYDRAYFGWVKFEADPEMLESIKKTLEANDKIIRFLIVKTVRENTLSRHTFSRHNANGNTDGKPKTVISNDEGNTPSAEAAPATEAEIDKQIEALVVE